MTDDEPTSGVETAGSESRTDGGHTSRTCSTLLIESFVRVLDLRMLISVGANVHLTSEVSHWPGQGCSASRHA